MPLFSSAFKQKVEQMDAEVMERPPSSQNEELRRLEVRQREDAAAAEEVFVDKETVAKLSEGLLAHYLPDLQKSQGTLHELTQNQLILLDTLDQEVTKFREFNALLDLNSLFTEAKVYHNKLVNIRKEMIT
uniref:Biogenesis of lysosome-related organelles complex 1 subunit 6 n=1 Tax=Tetraodon nigroviridis TaxID=99883 RepID=H3CVX7_TETNG